ncbi:MAG: c-type cytochrome [Limnobacter sp.]|nr:c-type cytochrome [Limnobacter sp.]
MFRQLMTATAAVLILLSGNAHAQVNEEAAQALAKKAKCTKCHSVDKKKDGPAYQDVAEKYKGKADAVDKLYTHLTTGPMVEVDGEKEEHEILRASDDEIRNLIGWILSR